MINDIVVSFGCDVDDGIFVGSCGYEARSSYFVDHVSLRNFSKILIGDYESTGTIDYNTNRKRIGVVPGVNLVPMETLPEKLNAELAGGATAVTIDVSSLDRFSMASLLGTVFARRKSVDVVKLLYFPQKFVRPSFKLETVKSFGPVTPLLAGRPSLRDRKSCLIFGAGYEIGKAIGAIDTLEPDEVFCFKPNGVDERFVKAIEFANMDFEFMTERTNIIEYDVMDPFALYMVLRSLVEAKYNRTNLVILPMGPKLFAAICMVVALIYHPQVRIWRHSTVSGNDPASVVQATALGIKASFEFRFVPGQ